MEKQEIIELLFQANKGNVKAYEELAKDGLRLCVAFAKKYEEYGTDLPLVVAAGFRGWNLSIKPYIDHIEKDKNHRFATYSTWWIRMEIHKLLGLSLEEGDEK